MTAKYNSITIAPKVSTVMAKAAAAIDGRLKKKLIANPQPRKD
jgi:hypothetical protein